ncbi:unnamed protein product [Citrullus colocynthis]|uniref:Uncharacterized protein n=1 Tax=Citrullus colocynthis TaxID=252529 RepID=A0ABP0YX35_9ROSI
MLEGIKIIKENIINNNEILRIPAFLSGKKKKALGAELLAFSFRSLSISFPFLFFISAIFHLLFGSGTSLYGILVPAKENNVGI